MTSPTLNRSRSMPAQAWWIGRYLSTNYLWVLLWALVVGVIVNGVLLNLPVIVEFFTSELQLDSDSWIAGPPVAVVGITAFVIAIVNSGYSRILIAQGATRGAITAGNLIALAVGWLFIAVVMIVSLLLDDVFPFTRLLDQFFGPLVGGSYVQLGGFVAVILAFGSLITAVYQRWHWIVGTVVVVIAVVFGPTVLQNLDHGVRSVVGWMWSPWLILLLVVGVFAWVLRGVEVN